MRMGSFDRKVATIIREIGGNAERSHPEIIATRTLTSLKWGRMTCSSTRAFKDSLSRSPSLNHYGAAPMATWVTSLSVVLGLTPSLIDSRVT
jgi:hypothetical protein